MEHAPLVAPTEAQLSALHVFPLIHNLKLDIVKTIDAPLTWEQLTASEVTFSVIRPLVDKYARLNNMSIVYACFVVKSYFLAEADADLSNTSIMLARASMAEIMAMKLITHFASHRLQLVAVLTTCWSPLAGAPQEVVDQVQLSLRRSDHHESPQSAIEVAIRTESKQFLSSSVCQKVINDIYSGRIVYSSQAHRSILADNYKPRAIEVYDCRRTPFLNHYRLRVPKYNAILKFVNFTVLLLTYVLCLSGNNLNTVTPWEGAFMIFAGAFVLGEYSASMEYGWTVYMANMWNVFDASFVLVYLVYMGLRIKGLLQHDTNASILGFDILACGACILFPRLAFFAVSNNVVILALRAMIVEFVFFIGIAAICFSGLLFTLWTLAADTTWTLRSIAWLMVQIWFGNTYLSFAQAESFHPVFGPILMTGFAALSNTLLLTILISILSNTFSRIDSNANNEYLFQFAITTIEGVKSDALFSYQPPFNLLAFAILKPASFLLSPRALHSLNVFLIKLTSFPLLFVIGCYERYFAEGQRLHASTGHVAHSLYNTLPRHLKNIPILDVLVGTSTSDFYDAIFEVETVPGCDIFEESENDALGLRSTPSRDSMRTVDFNGRSQKRSVSTSKTPVRGERSPRGSPMPRLRRNLPALAKLTMGRGPSSSIPQSPVSKLLNRQSSVMGDWNSNTEDILQRLELLVHERHDEPERRLKEELKDLQDRQSRIENLLIQLTGGMKRDARQT